MFTFHPKLKKVESWNVGSDFPWGSNSIPFNPFNFCLQLCQLSGPTFVVTLYLQQYFLVLYPLSTLYKCEGYNNNQHLYALGSNKCVFQQITTLWFHFIYFFAISMGLLQFFYDKSQAKKQKTFTLFLWLTSYEIGTIHDA